jgi:hypothetical protein
MISVFDFRNCQMLWHWQSGILGGIPIRAVRGHWHWHYRGSHATSDSPSLNRHCQWQRHSALCSNTAGSGKQGFSQLKQNNYIFVFTAPSELNGTEPITVLTAMISHFDDAHARQSLTSKLICCHHWGCH